MRPFSLATRSRQQASDVTSTALPSIVEDGYARCERIAAHDKPHLYTASRLFTYPETQRAFAATYASMRLVDDFVDNIPHRQSLAAAACRAAKRHIADWMRLITNAHAGQPGTSPLWHALTDTFAQFDLPLEPWKNLAGAMESDLTTPFFRNWDHLRQYMAGASVAPAVVFMYLVLMRPERSGGRFVSPWPYEEVLAATEDLAIFCYCVHILRDVAVDLSLGKDGLVYLPLADLEAFGLTVADLRAMKASGGATDRYRRLAHFEAKRARRHLDAGQQHLRRVLDTAPAGNTTALGRLIETYVVVLQGLSEREFDVFGPGVAATV
jgi:phytoene/squalene synthetase